MDRTRATFPRGARHNRLACRKVAFQSLSILVYADTVRQHRDCRPTTKPCRRPGTGSGFRCVPFDPDPTHSRRSTRKRLCVWSDTFEPGSRECFAGKYRKFTLFAPPPPASSEQAEEATPPQDEAEDAAAQDEEGSDGLTPEEEEEVADLKQRDAEVRRHEQAHAAIGGQYASAPRYQYETGPDGVQYAVDGEVSIAASPIPGDPEATIEKAQQVRRAALAPESPSAQDQQVAALAQQQINQARAELARQEQEDRAESANNDQNQAPDPTAPDDDRASRSLFAAQAFQQSQQLGAQQRPSQLSG